MAGIPVDRRMRRWREQRWLLDDIIAAVGVDWDPRIFIDRTGQEHVDPMKDGP